MFRLELSSNAWAGVEDFNWLKKVGGGGGGGGDNDDDDCKRLSPTHFF